MPGPILRFLFGKQTNIFNPKGKVQHDLGENKWKAWNDRLKNNPEYDWRQHHGEKPNKAKPDSGKKST